MNLVEKTKTIEIMPVLEAKEKLEAMLAVGARDVRYTRTFRCNGKARFHPKLTKKMASLIVAIHPELDAMADLFGVPRLRAYSTYLRGRFLATMSNGVMRLKASEFNCYCASVKTSGLSGIQTPPGVLFAYQFFLGIDGGRSLLYHEFAHHIHQSWTSTSSIPETGRILFEKKLQELWISNRRKWRKRQVSDYAKKNTREWFAENFSLIMMDMTEVADPIIVQIVERLLNKPTDEDQVFEGLR